MRDHISTHILDTATGFPASGINLSLFSCTNELSIPLEDNETEYEWQKIISSTTDSDGRAKLQVETKPGMYRLVFYTKQYFHRKGTANFYPYVEIVFRIADPTRHHHVPLLISPFGYSTYRGS